MNRGHGGVDATSMAKPLADVVPEHAPAGQLVVLLDGATAVDAASGSAGDNDGELIDRETLFDLASVTKIFTALAFMRLVERREITLDGRVVDLLPGFGQGTTPSTLVTWRHLLAHASGLPAGVDLGQEMNPPEAREHVLAVAPIEAPGTVRYSDVGFMVLGFAIEALTGASLDRVMADLVTMPAGLASVTFRPDKSRSIAPTELVPGRSGRLRGEVHDENAAALGGIAGHAGLFGTATDVARLGALLLAGGGEALSPSTVAEMTREQADDGEGMRRGLGFSLWSADPDASGNPLGPRSFGHTGFTGTSLWVDPDRRLLIALLTNAVFRGRDFDAFLSARIRAHRSIVAAADAAGRRVEAAP
jgi:CubicO group peptidase (beta-lactamase class C family)